MLSADNINVSSSFSPVLVSEWEKAESFQVAAESDEFNSFVMGIIPLVTGPITPELYATDVGPSKVFGANLTEVFRVSIGEDEEKEVMVRKAWGRFVDGIKERGEVVKSLSGISFNIEKRIFLGALGWKDSEVRENFLKEEVLQELKEKLGAVGSFLVKFGGL